MLNTRLIIISLFNLMLVCSYVNGQSISDIDHILYHMETDYAHVIVNSDIHETAEGYAMKLVDLESSLGKNWAKIHSIGSSQVSVIMVEKNTEEYANKIEALLDDFKSENSYLSKRIYDGNYHEIFRISNDDRIIGYVELKKIQENYTLTLRPAITKETVNKDLNSILQAASEEYASLKTTYNEKFKGYNSAELFLEADRLLISEKEGGFILMEYNLSNIQILQDQFISLLPSAYSFKKETNTSDTSLEGILSHHGNDYTVIFRTISGKSYHSIGAKLDNRNAKTSSDIPRKDYYRITSDFTDKYFDDQAELLGQEIREDQISIKLEYNDKNGDGNRDSRDKVFFNAEANTTYNVIILAGLCNEIMLVADRSQDVEVLDGYKLSSLESVAGAQYLIKTSGEEKRVGLTYFQVCDENPAELRMFIFRPKNQEDLDREKKQRDAIAASGIDYSTIVDPGINISKNAETGIIMISSVDANSLAEKMGVVQGWELVKHGNTICKEHSKDTIETILLAYGGMTEIILVRNPETGEEKTITLNF